MKETYYLIKKLFIIGSYVVDEGSNLILKDLIEQLKGAIEHMEQQHRDYEELHLSKEECEYILKLITEENT